MLSSRSAARKLVTGLRGYANAKKKAPGFYKPNPANSAEGTAAQSTGIKEAASGSGEVIAAGKTPLGQEAPAAEAAEAATKPAAGAGASVSGSGAPPAASSAAPMQSAAAAPKPEAPATSAAASAVNAAKTGESAAANTAPTRPANAAAAAPKPAEPAAGAPKPKGPATADPKQAAPAAAAARSPAPTAGPSEAGAAAAAPKPVPPATPSTATAGVPKPTGAAPTAPKPVTAAGGGGAGQQAGGAASSGGSRSGNGGNVWLLHPSVPIDGRLLGAGIVGAGALAYSLSGSNDGSSGSGKPPEAKQGGEEASFSMRPEEESATSAPDGAAATKAATDGTEAAGAASEEESGAAGESPAQPQPHAEGEAPPPSGNAAAGEEGEEVKFVDGSKVLGVIEEVFSKEAVEQLRELEERAAKEVAEAAAANQRKMEQAGGEVAEAASEAVPAAGEESKAAPAAVAAKEAAAAAAAARRAEEDVAAIQYAMSDQAGEAIASEFVQRRLANPPSLTGLLQAGKLKAGSGADAAADSPEQPPPQPAPSGPAADEVADALARAQRLLGIEVDVSAAGLIAEALKHGMGPTDDWTDYQQRHRQAQADAVVLADLLQSAAASVDRQLAAARAEAEAGHAEAAAARRQLARQAEAFKAVLHEALAQAEEQQRQQLRRQGEELATAHAEMTVRERAERAAKLDEVREKLNVLERAFQRRSNEQRTSHTAHQLAVGVFALLSALEGGQTLAQPLTFLRSLAAQDPVVAAALAAVPQEAAAAPVPTRAQLADRFQDVQRLSRALGMLPEGQGGMLSVAVAKLAAKLKVAERGPLALQLPGGGIDCRLAAAQQRVVDGDLLAAAAELEAAAAGTAAAGVVADWVHVVRMRVTAEQSAALLEAHAAAETASLA